MVSAAAGTGKTAVLVGRIMGHLKDPVNPIDINRLLVVTYTNAAAAEMRERIRAELASEISRNPESMHLRRQMILLNDACIATMHSFCLDVVREHFYMVGLDPAFRLADETEAELLQLEVLEALLEEKYAGGDASFFALVDLYGGERDDEGLKELVLKLFRFSRSLPCPGDWLRQVAGEWAKQVESIDAYAWCEELKQGIGLEIGGCIEEIKRAIALCLKPGGPVAYIDNLKQDLKMLGSLSSLCKRSWAELGEGFHGASFAGLKPLRKKDGIRSELQEQVKTIRDQVKKRIDSIRKTVFSRTPEQQANDMRRMAPVVEALIGLVSEFGERYRGAKERRSMLDFSDLEHYCLRILSREDEGCDRFTPSSIALEFRERFVEILVDEYQDINAVQEAILNLISKQEAKRSSIFMVGDVKQSIYRFRLAEPGLFLEKYHRYPRQADNGERRIDLKQNYRSRDRVIEAVNYLFGQIMAPGVAEMKYGGESELVPGSVYPDSDDGKDLGTEPVQLVIVDAAGDGVEPGDDSLEEQWDDDGVFSGSEEQGDNRVLFNQAQLEARLVAAEIERLRKEGVKVWDREAGDYRPLCFRDIAILLRTTRGAAQAFVEELRRAGIPAYAQVDTGYFDAIEVKTVLSLLNIIDNPRQDIPLLAVLRSPIGGFNAAELAEIRVHLPEGSFYEAAVRVAGKGDNPVGKKLQEFFRKLEGWRTVARRRGTKELLWNLFEDTGYYDYAGAMPGGKQRQANLRLLETWAARYENSSFTGLFHFLRFVERMQENGWEMGTAAVTAENDDAVRVVSIHRSKGLEFPLVFVAGLGRMFNFADLRGKVLVHRKLGIGLEFVDRDLAMTYPTLAKMAVKNRIRREMLAEEMRLLYVAMTRAREKLVLVGTVKNLNKSAGEWCRAASTGADTLPEAVLARARCYLDWIAPAAVRQAGGLELWQRAGEENGQQEGEVYFDVRVVKASELEERAATAPRPKDDDSLFTTGEGVELAAGDGLGEVERRLSWRYPWEKALGKKAKFSVTEARNIFAASGEWYGPEEEMRRTDFVSHPRFYRKTGGITAAERGSIMHLVLQHVDPAKAGDVTGVKRELEEMVAREILGPDQIEVVDIDAIAGLFAGELGRRIVRAGEAVLRELPFSLSLPAEELYSGELCGYGERVLVQGVIDCLLDEGDGFVLIDYKTDELRPGRVEELVAKYRPQVDLYALAVERILKKPVKEKYLYFLSGGLAVKI